jgi:mannose-6-phosphate isomerase-like protein (cupin superfamily)
MKTANVNQIPSFQNAHGVDARKIYETKDADVIHMALSPRQALKKHTTPIDVFFYILEGKGEIEIGNETQQVEKDTIIDSPKGIPHLLRNTGEGVFRFLVVKLPKTA